MSKFDDAEIDEFGVIYIKIIKDNGKNHRTSIPPGFNPVIQMNLVNEHLELLGMSPVSDDDIQLITNIVTQIHTPEMILKYQTQLDSSLLSISE